MDVIGMVKEVARACAEFCKGLNRRREDKNTEPMKQAVTAKQAEGRNAEIQDAIEKEDVDRTRRIIS